MTSGVPQGSVLGPTLFLMYVNELPDLIRSDLKMFADDVKLFKGIECPDDIRALQEDLNALSLWSMKWRLDFNIGKCKVMHLGRQNPLQDYLMKQSDGSAVKLQASKLERDLGVHVADTLKAAAHCQTAARKASTALRQLKMAFPTLRVSSFKPLFTTYVRPHIEYGMQAVGPYMRKDIKLLESVQRRATKLVRGLRHLPYEERLKRLKLMKVEDRLKRGDLIEAYKLLTGKLDVDPRQFFRLCENSRTRGHALKLALRRSNLQPRSQFFSNRVTSAWNRLPAEVTAAPSVNSFKNRLDRHWASEDDH